MTQEVCQNTPINQFLVFSMAFGVSGVIINNSHYHDLNNGFFIESFYNNYDKGLSPGRSFEESKYSLRSRKDYNHPAFWEGIRIYKNGL